MTAPATYPPSEMHAAYDVTPAIAAMRERAARLIGSEIRMTFEADPSYGVTLRWGTLREVTGAGLVVDGYHDCAGIKGRYPDHRGDGVVVEFGELLELRAA